MIRVCLCYLLFLLFEVLIFFSKTCFWSLTGVIVYVLVAKQLKTLILQALSTLPESRQVLTY